MLLGVVVVAEVVSCAADSVTSLVVGGVAGAGGASSLLLDAGQYGHGSASAGM